MSRTERRGAAWFPARVRRWAVGGLVLAALGGCIRLDMYDQPRYKPYAASSFFADGKSARALPAGTVPRGFLREDRHLHRGMTDDTTFARSFPAPVTRATLDRGRERYNIYCTPCHDYVGTGRGMVVRRGFKQPPSFHQDRLRDAPVGYLFDVMTNGFGTMSSYATQVPAGDRWAIAAYVRALQYSQNAKLAELPAAERRAFEAALRGEAAPAGRDAHGMPPGGHGGEAR